jgi:hypothetical protein
VRHARHLAQGPRPRRLDGARGGEHPRFGDDWLAWTPFTYPFNLTGQPGATVPCGLTRAGLPVGAVEAAVPAGGPGYPACVTRGTSRRDHGRAASTDGTIAVVTGADSGIGQATAVLFAQAGADLCITYHTDDPGEQRVHRRRVAHVELRHQRPAPGRLDLSARLGTTPARAWAPRPRSPTCPTTSSR